MANPIITNLPACTQEDGSDVGQVFPCIWDSAVHGNGLGKSFVLTGVFTDETATYLDEGTSALCGPGTELDLAGTACVDPTAVVAAAPAAPPTLASTGVDPMGAVVAASLIVAGVGALISRRLLSV